MNIRLNIYETMSCYNHPEIVAVAQCYNCHKFLCKRCIENDEPVLCKTCCTKHAFNYKRKALIELSVIFGVGFLIYSMFDSSAIFHHEKRINNEFFIIKHTNVLLLYLSFGIVAGWKTLNKITPKIFFILPLIGWFIYFIVKFYASLFVGIVMLPVRIFKNIRILLTKSIV